MVGKVGGDVVDDFSARATSLIAVCDFVIEALEELAVFDAVTIAWRSLVGAVVVIYILYLQA